MGGQYPAEYVKHHIDRLHKPGALRLLDLELSGPDEIAPGIVCEAAGGHTEGSMNILVETAEGTACICGDVIYDIQNQVIDPIYQVLDYEPQSTGNQGTSKRHERAAIKKALNSGTFLLPIHDYPARIENQRVVSRFVGDSVPGPRSPSSTGRLPRRGRWASGCGVPPPARSVGVVSANAAPYESTGMYGGSSRDAIAAFKHVLDRARIPATVRLTRGRDIAAACGQLAATR